ncbi:MAG: hypothetical protein S0880_07655, partial [Actinomycetota bacterium]|nr:hypothetical protein [Actinomycetota bacterium]
MTVAILLVPTIGGTVGYVLYSRFDVGLSTSQRASVDSNSGPLGPNVPAPADEADEASDDDDGPAVTA